MKILGLLIALLPCFSSSMFKVIEANCPIEYGTIREKLDYRALVKTLKLLLGKDEKIIESIYYSQYPEYGSLDCYSNSAKLWGCSIYYESNRTYESLNEFEKKIFDYYRFNRKKSVMLIGPFVDNSSDKHKYLINRSLHSGDKFQFLEWDIYDSVEDVPLMYWKLMKDFQEVKSREDIKMGLLFDKNNSSRHVLLGVTFFERPLETYYVGPRVFKNIRKR